MMGDVKSSSVCILTGPRPSFPVGKVSEGSGRSTLQNNFCVKKIIIKTNIEMEHLCLKRPSECQATSWDRHPISIGSFNFSFEWTIRDTRHRGKKTQEEETGLAHNLLTCSVRCRWCDRMNLVYASGVFV